MNIRNSDQDPSQTSDNSSAERPRGRPADTKSGKFQTALLNAAELLFAENGYAATSVRTIAERASVNPALVHYYFGTKHELLLAGRDRAVQPLAEGIAALRASGSGRLVDFAELFFNMAAEHPAMPKLITREVLLSGGETKEIFTRNYAPRIGGALPALLSKEQKDGRISADFDPGAAALMLLSLCIFPFVARVIAEPVLGIQYSKEGLRDYLQQMTTLLKKGMS